MTVRCGQFILRVRHCPAIQVTDQSVCEDLSERIWEICWRAEVGWVSGHLIWRRRAHDRRKKLQVVLQVSEMIADWAHDVQVRMAAHGR